MQKKFGFSLIELLLVIAIIGIIALATTPFLSSFVRRTTATTTADIVTSTLRKAYLYTVSSKNGDNWSACYTSNVIRLFRGGSCASPTNFEDYVVPTSVTVSGFSSVTFQAPRGEPSTTLSITVSNNLESKTITLNEVGMIDEN